MNTSLVPRRFDPYIDGGTSPFPVAPVAINPLAVLAETDPPAATTLMHRQLDIEGHQIGLARALGRTQVARQISSDHTAQITELIRAACSNGSRNVDAEVTTDGVVCEERFWFNRGERVTMKTTFRGRSW
jgi:hypothetical protein